MEHAKLVVVLVIGLLVGAAAYHYYGMHSCDVQVQCASASK